MQSLAVEHQMRLVVLAKSSCSAADVLARQSRLNRRMLHQLPAGSSVFWLSDNPEFGEPVPVCLSAHLRNTAACGALQADALDAERSAADAAAVRRAGGTYVDTSAWLCRDLRCPVISGNTLMYRECEIW